MGGSMLAQVLGQFGDAVPDLDDPALLKALVDAVNALRAAGLLLAYHDRSDGGLWAAVCEMAFAGHLGVSLNVDLLVTEGDGIADSRAEYGDSKNWAQQVSARREELTLRALFNEELGVVIQVPTRAPRRGDADAARRRPRAGTATSIGKTNDARRGRGLARRQGGVQRAAARPAPGLGRGQLAHRAAARQPGLRRRRARGGRRATTIRACTSISASTRRDRTWPRAGARRHARPRSRSCASRASTATSS